MRILITNDDGVHAPGIKALRKAVSSEHEVIVAAPATERSASGHSITLGQRLRVEEFFAEGARQFAVHGTPADAVKFALGALRDFHPDLILSGINQGANTGVSVYYSGTISAAREGFINQVPAVAVSLCSRSFQDFGPSIQVARMLVEGYEAGRFSRDVMLNVNVPPLPASRIKGIRVTKQASSRFIEEFVLEKSHRGKKVYSLTGEIEMLDPDGTSDEESVVEGWIAITPLHLDLTAYDGMKTFKKWAANGRWKKGIAKASRPTRTAVRKSF